MDLEPTKEELTDRAMDILRDAGLPMAALRNLIQVGWVLKDNPTVFRNITELSVMNLGERPLRTPNNAWEPVYMIRQD